MDIRNISCHLPQHNCASCHGSAKLAGHEEAAHKCEDKKCEVVEPHGHINPEHDHENCKSCLFDHIKDLFPFQESLKRLKVSENETTNNFIKEVFANICLFTPALSISEISGKLLSAISSSPLNAYAVPPLSITAMQLANKGKQLGETVQIGKLLLTGLTTSCVTWLQKAFNFPRAFVRALVAVPIFYIEKIGLKKENDKNKHEEEHHHHTHEDSCNHKHHEHTEKVKPHDEEEKEQKKSLSDLIALVRLQVLVNSVPSLLNIATGKLKAINNDSGNIFTKFFGNVGIFLFKVTGLSFGFVSCGKLIDKIFGKLGLLKEQNKIKSNVKDENQAGRVEAVTCACCGAPACVVEAATEAATESSVVLLAPEHLDTNNISEPVASLLGSFIATGALAYTLSQSDKKAA